MLIFSILLTKYQSFLYCSPFSHSSSNFAILKVVGLNLFASKFLKDLWYLFCITLHVVLTNNYHYYHNEGNKIKSDNSTRSNIEKCVLESTIIILHFWGTNNIFSNYKCLTLRRMLQIHHSPILKQLNLCLKLSKLT